jgi:hypothetical protein
MLERGKICMHPVDSHRENHSFKNIENLSVVKKEKRKRKQQCSWCSGFEDELAKKSKSVVTGMPVPWPQYQVTNNESRVLRKEK